MERLTLEELAAVVDACETVVSSFEGGPANRKEQELCSATRKLRDFLQSQLEPAGLNLFDFDEVRWDWPGRR